MIHSNKENFQNQVPLVTSQGSPYPKKCEMLKTFEENGLGSDPLKLRKLTFKTTQTKYQVPVTSQGSHWPKKCQVLITFEENGLGS